MGIDTEEIIAQCQQIQGWMSDQELAWLIFRASQMQSVLEIGSWLGRSTLALCLACPGTVYTVDRYLPEDINLKATMSIHDVYNIFLDNVRPHLLSGKLVHHKLYSLQAAMSPDLPTFFDMVFIDADHDYVSCRRDIKLWKPRTRKLICGHDYQRLNPDKPDKEAHPGVTRAVNEAFGNKVQKEDTIWFVELS